MSTGAIIMMIIGCGGLWGGFALSCIIAIKHGKKDKSSKS
ncbi:MAG: methionine/alanine import family NSS transporter small subunit [Anaerovoracaceae bacterium]